MPSPFPGMNPYLEQPAVWQDFHNSYLVFLRDQLHEQIRPTYFVKLEEYLFIRELPEQRRALGRSDVAVAGTTGNRGGVAATSVLEAPAYGLLEPAVEIERHSYLEIRDRQHLEVITVIEVLSPSNKRVGLDRDQYLAKRGQFLVSTAHLVEIDILRGGPRLPVEGLTECDYCVLVSRYEDRPRVGLWPLRLRERLPHLPIPLRSPSECAHLDLQLALHRVFDSAGYNDYIYSGVPEPPLSKDDAAWALQFVTSTPASAGNGSASQ